MLGRLLFAVAILGAVVYLLGCVGDVQVRSDGNMTCQAPAYDITAFSCGFDMTCNAKAAIDITNSDWDCQCNVRPKRGKDLHLECALTSSTVETL